ncbi:MAG: caspase family protein [Pseudomonadota bacterium]
MVAAGILMAAPSQAVQALLVGVGEYGSIASPLEGPAHDVASVSSALSSHWSVPRGNIVTLVDEQATRSRILTEIELLLDRTSAGEDVFVYMSGHGTSALDRDNALPLPTTSGAFIPYIERKPRSVDGWIQALVIGRRDLNPLFRRLDEAGRQVFVVIDACYSGNTVRSAFSSMALQNRYVDFAQLVPHPIPNRSFGDDLGGDFGANTIAHEAYPYDNVFYLGASGEHEVAQDIPGSLLKTLPTLDGKPHGAFTDAFLRVITGRLPADQNDDGYLAYGEIYQSLRGFMGERPYTHTPSRLPAVSDDETSLSSRSFFGRRAPKPNPPAKGPFIVDVGSNNELARALANQGIAVFDVASGPSFSLEVRTISGATQLIDASGNLITTLQTTKQPEVTNAVLVQRKIHEWVNNEFDSDFALFTDVQGLGAGSTRRGGDVLGFSARSGKRSFLLMLNVGPSGNLSVLYPYDQEEVNAIPAKQLVALHDLTRVAPPYGREIVDVFAFQEWPSRLDPFLGESFSIASREGQSLIQALMADDLSSARSTLAVFTASP